MRSDLGHRNLAYRTEVQRARLTNMADAHPVSPASFYLSVLTWFCCWDSTICL